MLGIMNIYINNDSNVKDRGFNPELISININVNTTKIKEYKYFLLRHV